MYIVYETLKNLGVKNKPVITVFNKQDRAALEVMPRDFKADITVKISARTGEGLDVLMDKIELVLREQKITVQRLYSYQEAAKIQVIRKYGELIEEEYGEEGISVKAYVPAAIYDKVK